MGQLKENIAKRSFPKEKTGNCPKSKDYNFPTTKTVNRKLTVKKTDFLKIKAPLPPEIINNASYFFFGVYE